MQAVERLAKGIVGPHAIHNWPNKIHFPWSRHQNFEPNKRGTRLQISNPCQSRSVVSVPLTVLNSCRATGWGQGPKSHVHIVYSCSLPNC